MPVNMSDFDILMIGNFAKDKIIVDGVEQIMSGSGVYFGSVVIRRLGLKVAVVTRLHPSDFHRLDEIRAEGVEVFAAQADGTSGIANYYDSKDMERRICKPIGFGGKYAVEQIPNISARLIILSPLFAGEVDLPFLQAMAQRAPVAMDIQGFVRVIAGDDLLFQPWVDMAEGLKSITYLKVDRAEAEYLTGLDNPRKAAVALSRMGPKEIVLTQSSGVMAYAGRKFYQAPFNPRSLAGRTGRGDTCFCSYLAKRLDHDPQTAVNWAGVITSLKQETPGPILGQ
jgi:sugar/nucleoside kinase (ribokinase family)